MDAANERRLAARVKALGEGGSGEAFAELAGLTRSPSALLRRLAASALGKLAGIVPSGGAVAALQPMLGDDHPQVRQYAAKALGAYGVAAAEALPDLRDLYRNPAEKEYVKRSVTIQAKDGTLVQSEGERLVCDALEAEGIAYRYDERFRILDGYAIRPDFYLPEFDVYVEYWGMDTADYKIGMLKKQKLYQQQGKKLISLYPADKSRMRAKLAEKLRGVR